MCACACVCVCVCVCGLAVVCVQEDCDCTPVLITPSTAVKHTEPVDIVVSSDHRWRGLLTPDRSDSSRPQTRKSAAAAFVERPCSYHQKPLNIKPIQKHKHAMRVMFRRPNSQVKIVDFGLSNTHDGGRKLKTACNRYR